MHRKKSLIPAFVALALTLGPVAVQAQDESRTVADGGVFVEGWTGKIDAREASRGQVLENSRLASEGGVLHVTTGPAVTYWNAANRASGNYTVSATFHEPLYMNLNNHPHPYGIVIAGNDMGTDSESYLYCAAYGSGTFIVRGMGPEPFRMNGRRAQPHDAVNQAAGRNQPVTQEIALSVMDDTVECSINGTVVASYDRSELVMDGKLKSTDGIWGIRFAHNTEGTVTDLKVTRR